MMKETFFTRAAGDYRATIEVLNNRDARSLACATGTKFYYQDAPADESEVVEAITNFQLNDIPEWQDAVEWQTNFFKFIDEEYSMATRFLEFEKGKN